MKKKLISLILILSLTTLCYAETNAEKLTRLNREFEIANQVIKEGKVYNGKRVLCKKEGWVIYNVVGTSRIGSTLITNLMEVKINGDSNID